MSQANKSTLFVCSLCNKDFLTNSSLRRHVRTCHPDVEPPPVNRRGRKPKPSDVRLPCETCGAVFTNRKALRHHWWRHSLCRPKDLPIIKIERVMRQQKCVLEFGSEADFLRWKCKEEDATLTRFVKNHGDKHLVNHSAARRTYICHRSGRRVSKNDRLSVRKARESRKIGDRCPAAIFARILSSGRVSVNYYPEHRGHDNEVIHLNLRKSQRQIIADKLSSGMSGREVLKWVRNNSSSGKEFSYTRTVTWRDLQNIIRDFGIKRTKGSKKKKMCANRNDSVYQNDMTAEGSFNNPADQYVLHNMVCADQNQVIYCQDARNESICYNNSSGLYYQLQIDQGSVLPQNSGSTACNQNYTLLQSFNSNNPRSEVFPTTAEASSAIQNPLQTFSVYQQRLDDPVTESLLCSLPCLYADKKCSEMNRLVPTEVNTSLGAQTESCESLHGSNGTNVINVTSFRSDCGPEENLTTFGSNSDRATVAIVTNCRSDTANVSSYGVKCFSSYGAAEGQEISFRNNGDAGVNEINKRSVNKQLQHAETLWRSIQAAMETDTAITDYVLKELEMLNCRLASWKNIQSSKQLLNDNPNLASVSKRDFKELSIANASTQKNKRVASLRNSSCKVKEQKRKLVTLKPKPMIVQPVVSQTVVNNNIFKNTASSKELN